MNYTALKFVSRELRGGFKSFWIFLICLGLGAMALSTIGSVKKSINVGLSQKATEILGGDGSLRFTYRFANKIELAFIKANSLVYTETTDFRSMATLMKDQVSIDSALIQIKGVDEKYPLYGAVKLHPEQPLYNALAEINGIYGIVAAKSLMNRLDLKIGEKVRIGNNLFEIRAELLFEPDAGSDTFSFAPRVIALNTALLRSNLLTSGTMFDSIYRFIKNPNSDINFIKEQTNTLFKESGIRWRDSSTATPGIDRFVDRLSSFLLLIGMAGLAIGGIGVALSVTSYLEGKSATIAVLRTVGASEQLIFSIYLIVIMFFSITGSTAGALLGGFIPFLLGPVVVVDFPIPITFSLYLEPIIEAIYYSVLTAIVFSIWPLGRMLNCSATNLLRRHVNVENVFPALRYQSIVVVILIILIFSFSLRSPQPLISISVFFGIAISLVGLLTMASLMKLICRKLISLPIVRKNITQRLALSSIAGPNNEVGLVMISIGLGLIVLATIGQIDSNLRYNIDNEISAQSPAFFFLDIQKSQLKDFEEKIILSGQVSKMSSAPMLRGVITRINNIPALEFAGDHWALRGDRGLTYADTPPKNNTIISGKWWRKNYSGDPEISFSSTEALEMGLSLGDRITVNLLGRDITGTITSLRNVNFASMQINFLMIFNSSSLQLAPHTHIATIYADEIAEKSLLRLISENFPNVTAIPTREALKQVSDTLATIASITRWSSVITIFIGFVVLIGVAATTEKKRTYEACILKTLGASKSLVLRIFALRSIVIGGGAGLMAIFVGNLTSWCIITFIMKSSFVFDITSAIIIVCCGIFTNLFSGLLFAAKPLSANISKTLRHED